MTASIIDEAIKECVLSERDRHILRRVMIDGVHYEQIAEELDVSRNTVQAAVAKWKPIVLAFMTT